MATNDSSQTSGNQISSGNSLLASATNLLSSRSRSPGRSTSPVPRSPSPRPFSRSLSRPPSRSSTPPPSDTDRPTASNEKDKNSRRLTISKRESRSKTISGDRPAIVTDFWQDEDKKPLDNVPATINISAPTPTTDVFPASITSTSFPSLKLEDLDQHTLAEGSSPKTPVVGPEIDLSPVPNLSVPSTSSSSTKNRNRSGSSVSNASVSTDGNSSNNMDAVPLNSKSSIRRSSSLSNKDSTVASRRRSTTPSGARFINEEDLSDTGGISDMAGAGSVANACGMETANSKRNMDFHALFRSVPEDDMLIEDYGCALQKEILIQGRLYISENHICFNANIFGWVTNLVIAFSEIISIDKKMTAIIIPNAIQISTMHARHLFASFLSRDQAHDQIIEIWNFSHPTHPKIQGSAHNMQEQILASSNDDRDNSEFSGSGSDLDSDYTYSSNEYTEEDDEDDSPKYSVRREAANSFQRHSTKHLDPDIDRKEIHSAPSTPAEEINKTLTNFDGNRRRARSEVGPRPSLEEIDPHKTDVEVSTNVSLEQETGQANPPKPSIQPFAKKPPHPPTECDCLKKGEHFDACVLDTTYLGSVEKLYNLLFTSGLLKKFLGEVEKSTDIEFGNWTTAEGGILVRDISHVKPLTGPIGPKQTRCLSKEKILHQDFDDYVTALTTTQTPDVPSGSAFSVKTRICIMWAEGDQTRIIATCAVEYTKSSWLKAAIDKAAIDGQATYFKNLDQTIRKYISAHPNEFTEHEPISPKHEKSRKKIRRRRRAKDNAGQDKHMPPSRQHSESSIRRHHNHREKTSDNFNSNMLQIIMGFLESIIGFVSGIAGTIEGSLSGLSSSQLVLLAMFAMFFANSYIFVRLRDVAKLIEDIHIKTIHRSALEERMLGELGYRGWEGLHEHEEAFWQWLNEHSAEGGEWLSPITDKFRLSREEFEASGNDNEIDSLARKHIAEKRGIDGHLHELTLLVRTTESKLQKMMGLVDSEKETLFRREEAGQK